MQKLKLFVHSQKGEIQSQNDLGLQDAPVRPELFLATEIMCGTFAESCRVEDGPWGKEATRHHRKPGGELAQATVDLEFHGSDRIGHADMD